MFLILTILIQPLVVPSAVPQPCRYGNLYCGSFLALLDWKIKPSENANLYRCLRLNQTELVVTCPHGCSNRQCRCLRGTTYCGHELRSQLRWTLGDNSSLYHCSESSTNVTYGGRCSETCNRGRCNNSPTTLAQQSSCQYGSLYCGRELREKLDWVHIWPINYDNLYRCLGLNQTTALIATCPQGCSDHRCRCRRGTSYCGHELRSQLRWSIPNDNGLYVCKRMGVDYVGICPGPCSQGRCTCVANTTYCGHENVTKMFHPNSLADHVYRCINPMENLVDDGYCPKSQCQLGVCIALPVENSTGQSICSPGRLYCGYRLEATHLTPKGLRKPHDSVFWCDSGGYLAHLIDVCHWRCTDNGGLDSAFCTCNPTAYYCGHELLRGFGWRGYDNNTLYLCSEGGLNASHVEVCSRGCNSSRCIGHCTPNKTYCGRKLRSMGWDGYKDNVLYLCDEGGKNVTSVISTCREGTCNANDCDCIPGQNYCGHELFFMGWTQVTSEADRQTLSRCTIGHRVKVIDRCDTCERQGNIAQCTLCTPNKTYCGRKLHSMGWNGYEDNVLYLCEEGGRNVTSVVSTCREGTCNTHCCDCIPGQNYCGHELFFIGYTQFTSEADRQTLRRCTKGKNAEEITKCGLCERHDGTARCICHNHTSCRCEFHEAYCGTTLRDMGWNGYYDDDTLYACEESEKSVNAFATCFEGCSNRGCRCTSSGRTYCGYELFGRERRTEARHGLSYLYRCIEGQAPKAYYCRSCLGYQNSSVPSRCACSDTGERLCGHQLYEMGWIGYDNNTLYWCKEAEVSVIRACSNTCAASDRYWHGESSRCRGDCVPRAIYCGSELALIDRELNGSSNSLYQCAEDEHNLSYTGAESSLCSESCVPGRTYCSYQLSFTRSYSHYHSPHDLNRIYRCDERGILLTTEAHECGVCVARVGRNSYCPCVPGTTYCASDLHNRGWDNGYRRDDRTLYRCVDGHSVEEIETCPLCSGRFYNEPAFCSCRPNVLYCGYVLTNYHHPFRRKKTVIRLQSIYLCPIVRVAKQHCDECISSNPPHCRKRCHMGRQYCALELLTLEGWSNTDIQPGWLHRCDGLSATPIRECVAGCRDRTSQQLDSSCKPTCQPGYRYCGWELAGLGWEGVESNGLYTCQNLTQELSVRSCQRCVTTRISAQCDEDYCVTGTQYCGSQLDPSINQGLNDYLFVCNRRRKYVKNLCRHGCVPSSPQHLAICKRECEVEAKYCGTDLLRRGWPGIFSNATYVCQNGSPVKLEDCRMQICKDAACHHQCKNNTFYCGHDLMALGFDETTPHTIYRCVNDQLVFFNRCTEAVCYDGKCDPTILRGGCGRPLGGTSAQIWMSKNASHQAWPWMVSLQVPVDRRVRCGGTLIHPGWILTAAHCLDEVDLVVGLGGVSSYDQRIANISNRLRHASYHANSLIGDIALVRLSQEMTHLPVCCLAEAGDVPPGLRCTVLGWGVTSDRGSPTTLLQEGTLQTLDPDRCREIEDREAKLLFNASTMICAGPVRQSDTFTCQGDSGGPLLCRRATYQPWTVYGVVSFGKACFGEWHRLPTAFTRVSTYYEWIQATINGNSRL